MVLARTTGVRVVALGWSPVLSIIAVTILIVIFRTLGTLAVVARLSGCICRTSTCERSGSREVREACGTCNNGLSTVSAMVSAMVP